MYYHELVVTIQLKKDVTNDEMYEFLSKMINNAMLYDEDLKEEHKKNKFKYYTYSSLNPIEQDKLYKKERIYYFNIRSIDKKFLLKLKRVMSLIKAEVKIIATEVKSYSQKFISNLVTLSPIVVSMGNQKYWTVNDGLKELNQRVNKNAVRKYNEYFSTEIPEETEFIQSIIQTNQKPIKVKYKNANLIGNKFQMEIKTDKLSQDLAFFIKATYMAEKGSIGCGYLASN